MGAVRQLGVGVLCSVAAAASPMMGGQCGLTPAMAALPPWGPAQQHQLGWLLLYRLGPEAAKGVQTLMAPCSVIDRKANLAAAGAAELTLARLQAAAAHAGMLADWKASMPARLSPDPTVWMQPSGLTAALMKTVLYAAGLEAALEAAQN
jgi:hypothetical protein